MRQHCFYTFSLLVLAMEQKLVPTVEESTTVLLHGETVHHHKTPVATKSSTL